jgi:hypothetical protein
MKDPPCCDERSDLRIIGHARACGRDDRTPVLGKRALKLLAREVAHIVGQSAPLAGDGFTALILLLPNALTKLLLKPRNVVAML